MKASFDSAAAPQAGRARPHVLYVTPLFGYPPMGGPRLRTYYTLRALARSADVSLYLTQQPDTADREQARAHLLTFCREVVFPPAPPAPSGLRRLLPPTVRARLRALRQADSTGPAATAIRAARRGGARLARHLQPPAAGVQESAWSLGDPPGVVVPHAPGGGETGRAALLAALRAWVEVRQPDLIWLGFGGISYDLVPLKTLTARPLVLETECVWSRFILRELPFATDPRERARILHEGRAKEAEERAGARLVDLTTAVSEVDAAYFRALAPDPARVMLLHNVIDVDAYAGDGRLALEQPALVFPGSLSRGTANVDAVAWLLDEIMPRVWRRQPAAHVYLVGRDPAPEVVARRSARVHVTGEVASIVPYLHASAAALVPLRWESGTRFKILEAFACRTPVVSTTLGAEGLDVEHGRDLLLADEPDTFAEAILSLLEKPALRQRLVGPAYELVRAEYDVRSAERQIGAILARLDRLPSAVPAQPA